MKNFSYNLKSEFTNTAVNYYNYKNKLSDIIGDFSTVTVYDPINKDIKKLKDEGKIEEFKDILRKHGVIR